MLCAHKCKQSSNHSHHLGSDWVNLKDPTVVAETELLNAAAAIEAAAKKLEELRPRPTQVCNSEDVVVDFVK